MQLNEFLNLLKEVKTAGSGYVALCPAHDDNQHSLSVSESASDNKILIHCHAGCEVKDITQSLGIKIKDLFTDNSNNNNTKNTPGKLNIVKTYDYIDISGRLLFQTVRLEPKSFRQRRPDPSNPGQWIWNLNTIKPVLYRLSEVIKEAQASGVIYIVEGEKDADRLRALGLTATTCPMGAGKWRGHYADYLAGAKIAILPDNDAPGQSHAELVARNIIKKVAAVKILNLPDLPAKGDVSDWLDVGGTKEQLQQLLVQTPKWEPAQKPDPEQNDTETQNADSKESTNSKVYIREINNTDLGNARRLIQLYGADIRYCDLWKKWLIYNGKCWVRDDTQEIHRRAKYTVREIYAEAAKIEDNEERIRLINWARASETSSRLKAMVTEAQSEVPIIPEELDRYHYLVNVNNGTIDLRTGLLRPHSRTDYLTRLIPIDYDSDNTCPYWEEFLALIMDNNQELITFLQRAVGYSLTGYTDERCMFILYGGGKNGKSTFIETVAKILNDYAIRTPTETLLARQNDAIPNDVARLKGARFVHASEAEEGRRLAESKIKDLTGGDTVTARFMRAEFFDFTPEFKLWLGTNHRPVIRGTDDAIWDRIRLIPFTVRLPEVLPPEKQLPRREVDAKFETEKAGILAWAVRGCLDWQEQGLGYPRDVKEATEGYRSEMDVLAEFFEASCIIDPSAQVTVKDLYESYKGFCENNGEKYLGKRRFGTRLRERGFDMFAGTSNVQWWRGIGLRDDGYQEGLSIYPATEATNRKNDLW